VRSDLKRLKRDTDSSHPATTGFALTMTDSVAARAISAIPKRNASRHSTFLVVGGVLALLVVLAFAIPFPTHHITVPQPPTSQTQLPNNSPGYGVTGARMSL